MTQKDITNRLGATDLVHFSQLVKKAVEICSRNSGAED